MGGGEGREPGMRPVLTKEQGSLGRAQYLRQRKENFLKTVQKKAD